VSGGRIGGEGVLEPISPLGPVSLAVSIDDLFLWKGTPLPDGYSPLRTTKELANAFGRQGLRGVYSFSNTAPTDDDRTLLSVFDHWVEHGHYVGNHTHHHASLNWIDSGRYIEDIEVSEGILERWMTRSPTKYFRYCMDMWGDTAEKRDAVEAFLNRNGYRSSPLSVWFYDHAWIMPFWRGHKLKDREALKYLRRTFVETALQQLRIQAAAARAMFGRDPAHIWLAHGSPLAGEAIDEILDVFQAANVRFVSLEEAMRDPIYASQPVVTDRFRNTIQKWAEFKNYQIKDVPPKILDEVDAIAPIPGQETHTVFGEILTGLCARIGGTFSWPGWD
jgi:peptidoglycan/xylan/chitin deacetylase (PgdA/CDA1 family)